MRHIALNVCEKRHAQKRSGVTVELSDELMQCIPAEAEGSFDKEAFGMVLNRFLRSLDRDGQYIFIHRYFHMESVKKSLLILEKRKEQFPPSSTEQGKN